MTILVAKDFNTTQRRFKAGDPVSILDDLSPHTFDDLKTRGFIAAKRDPAPSTAPVVDEPERAPRKK